MGILRIGLAVAVLLFHLQITDIAGISLIGGRQAVFCFFVISGFYMSMILTERYTVERYGKSYLKTFWSARFFRLYPIYILCIIFALSLAFWGLIPISEQFLWTGSERSLFDVFFSLAKLVGIWFSNLSMIFVNVPSVTKQLIVGPAWSIGIEISYYCLAPFALRWRPIWIVFAFTLGIALMFVPYGQHSPLFFGFHLFFLGHLAYLGYRKFGREIRFGPLTSWSFVSLAVLMVVLFPYPRQFMGQENPHTHNSVDSFLAPVLVAIILPFLHILTRKSKVDNWIGRLSYPFYMIHSPIIIAFSVAGKGGEIALQFVSCLVASIALSYIEDHWFEPIRDKIKTGKTCWRFRRTTVIN
ncbi:peptidoglycan/LPS O-acetylase OafA/YrhL [Pseudacidovorax intermedius]|uniref:Peptidoglycan/LPS O-acetylase OafA/YrhL n=1 Tax=Pseudacidovorax intermedius TaxID=433924 RepID=A0A370FEX8_9BURK|nr:acyltransferase [Pseudacidovorax intermedius]RDI24956.1 peptidoglycan/LPS O-acetylase OafA/YrhL [Pseudacidovorax intermedius]